MSNPSEIANLKAPFDSLTLRAVVLELQKRLVGGQIQDVRQPSTCELMLGIRSLGKNEILLLSCDARFARAHLTTKREPNAPTPPAFCMAVRKHCESAIVRAIRQKDFDRILEIEIGPRGDEADTATVTLVAELMGKHSNIILVSARGVILEAIKRISHKVNRVREVLPGLPYTTPPTQAGRLDPFDHATVSAIQSAMAQAPASTVKERADWLTGRVAGLSPFLSVHIATAVTHEPKEQPSRLPEVWGSIFGSIEQERFQPVQIHAGTTIVAAYPFQVAQIPQAAQQQVEDLNRALDAVYSSAVQSTTAAAKISQLLGETERDRKRVRRQLEIAERTLHEAGRAEQHKQAGELILANLWRIEAGANKVTVQDYFDPNLGDRELSLDPKLSAQENADALFRRYRKVRDGQATAGTRAAEARDQLVLLDAAANRLAELDASDVSVGAAVERLRLEMREQGLLQHRPQEAGEERAAGPDLQGHKIRRQTTPEGYEIYIGETATANDYLTTRLAAPNDLWLHVRASTSAHVVIKTNGKPDLVPKSVIEYAALVCARHSSQKHSGLVPVDYTLKKHVRKPRGAAPGSADYHHETTIHVEP